MRAVLLALAFMALSGPTQAQALKFRPQDAVAVPFQRPALSTEAATEPGQVVIAAGRANPAIVVTKGGKARVNGNRAEIYPGLYRLVARADAGGFYQPDKPMTLSAFGLGGVWPDGGLYIPDEKTSPPRVYFRSAIGLLFHGPVEGVAFEDAPPADVPGGFRRELIYGGVAKGVLTLSYREFVNDMARPAFTQVLTYDLAEGDEIAYQGARLKVLGANNTGLRYIVLAPLRPEP